MLVTEWSFPALDSGLPCTGGAGQRFRTQKLRTQATELFAKTMLSLPFLVGYDYFMWVDEPPEGISDAFPEDSNYGLINEKGEAYPEITQMFARLHRDMGAWRKAAVPAETAVPETRTEGETADRFLARINPGVGRATFTRDGDAYVIRNAAGLELRGRVGGRDFFEQVRLDGRDLGRYTAMLNDRVGGSPRWTDIAKVTAAELVAKDGRVVLTVTGERPGREFSFALTHRITVFADKPWFLCELIGAKNLGTAPLDVDAFFCREYSPFFADKLAKDFPKSVPNLWQAPAGDAWVAADGAFFGGFTRAPTSALFSYHIMDDGRSQHPDAAFSPERPLVLAPGATYAPKGTTWMLALCGTGGAAAWTRLVESF